ncbi:MULTISPECIES: glycosyltransferase family 2 protein [unclassified Cryobacterium]|uniref:glycosyltransferase family 2 protein n=1 Tax=unclassified Cryobacterium TaxID=2649013 RepID=UPI00106A2BFD|nr:MULTISPECIES: glycosyltransferase family 2 protein [unclassified Cryobacterium]TFC34533.1 glycosyltransferase family 2 protein [Cryobacterium sp. TMT2-42-4]TFC36639.1 glycosyltransferase family 2 protein [Cryobacterium sp. TMT2-14]
METARQPTVSVALCTFNGAAYIAQQLRSILSQTTPPSEIIVSDDASTDGTLGILERVRAEWLADGGDAAVDFRVIRNAVPLGVAANFEQALSECSGELLALSDQDDVWAPGRVQIMIGEFMRRPKLQLLHSDALLVGGDGNFLGRTLFTTLGITETEKRDVHQGRAFDVLLRRNIVTGATVMLRRDLVDRARPFPEAWVHDEWLAMVAAATGTVDFLGDTLVDYRQHGGNQIGVTSLDAAGRLSRLQAPRTQRNARLLARAEALDDRAPGLVPVPSDAYLRLIAAKAAHERARSALPSARLRRVLPVLRQWRTGGYARFGLGPQDVLRDLVQPL